MGSSAGAAVSAVFLGALAQDIIPAMARTHANSFVNFIMNLFFVNNVLLFLLLICKGNQTSEKYQTKLQKKQLTAQNLTAHSS
jgi:hypothetical protein